MPIPTRVHPRARPIRKRKTTRRKAEAGSKSRGRGPTTRRLNRRRTEKKYERSKETKDKTISPLPHKTTTYQKPDRSTGPRYYPYTVSGSGKSPMSSTSLSFASEKNRPEALDTNRLTAYFVLVSSRRISGMTQEMPIKKRFTDPRRGGATSSSKDGERYILLYHDYEWTYARP